MSSDRSERREMLARLKHPDPLSPQFRVPDENRRSPRWRAAMASPEMEMFREVLGTGQEASLRDAAIDDVESFFDEKMKSRLGAEGFMRSRSWALNLLWYAFLHAEGYNYPLNVVIAMAASEVRGVHLDFGSGAGVTSQLFYRMGYDIVLADAEPTLLDFAQFRLERRGQSASYINLLQESPEVGAYDVITAIDTLSFVPNLNQTMLQLHRALRPGGLLFANFPQVTNGGWPLLHHNDLVLAHRLRRVGFEPVDQIEGWITMYVRVDPANPAHMLRGLRDAVVMNPTARGAYRRIKRAIASR